MRSVTADYPVLDSPLDAVDALLTMGSGLGLLTYVTSLLLGNVETATVGVGVGVVCVLGVLSFRSARQISRLLGYPGADRTST